VLFSQQGGQELLQLLETGLAEENEVRGWQLCLDQGTSPL
jgi:hypothetical protein